MKSGPSAAYKFFCGRKNCPWLVKRIIVNTQDFSPFEFLDRVEFGNNNKKKSYTYHENLRSFRNNISQHFRIHHGISRHNGQDSRDTQTFFNQSIRIRLIRVDDFLNGGLIAVAFRS